MKKVDEKFGGFKKWLIFANEIRNDKEFFENIMTEVQIMKIGSTPWCNGSTHY